MTVLEQHLDEVGDRYRRADRWRWLSWLFVAITLVGLGLFYLQVSGQWMHRFSGWGLLIAAGLGALLVSITLAWEYRSQSWLADQVEDKYPELDQRLITTLGEVKKNQGQPLNYLQHTVLLETVAHAHHNPWSEVVPERSMNRIKTRGLFAMVMMMATAIGLLQFRPPASAFANNSTQTSEIEAAVGNFEVLVEPGDVEIERGENLIVVARFGKADPKDVELVTVTDGLEDKSSMTQSLDDPLYGGTVYEVDKAMDYFVRYSGTETKRYRVKVFVLPELVRSDAVIDFPSYTELPQKVIEDTRRVSAVEGSTLTWKMHLNKPGIRAKLVPKEEGAEEIELQVDPADPLMLVTSMELKKNQRWSLKLVDAQGRENRSAPTLSVKVTPNKPPKMKLELARDARVSPLEEFLVKATASDDYGVQKFGISYTLASAEPNEIVLGESIPRGEKSAVEHMLDFEALEAEPDQLLSYFFWAEDSDAKGETRRTLGDMFFTEVRHFEEIFRQGEQPAGGQQQQQQQEQQQQSQNEQNAEELSEVQKQIISATWNVMRRGNGDEKKFRDDVSVVLESQQAAAEQAAELSQELEDAESRDHMLRVQEFMQEAISNLTNAYSETSTEELSSAIVPERGAYEALLKLRAREHEVIQQQQPQQQGQQSQSQSRQRMQQQLNQLELQNDENRYETQRQAQEEEDEAQTEMRRALNQLKELAQRQEDLNKQLQELQTALEQAETEEERKEIERQLKRLREQQEEMLRDTDELIDRMEEAQDQEAMQDAQEQLEQTREQMRETSESLEEGEITPALASGTRAQRELEEMREELRKESANQFSDQMREMRDKARELEERQNELSEQLQDSEAQAPEKGGGLREGNERTTEDTQALRDELRQQRERLNELLDEMKETVQEAEESEPLLAEGLYDAFRDAEKEQLADKIEATAQLTERGLTEQARTLDEDVREGISELREEIDQAAERVLGDQTEALRLAIQTLKDLEGELQSEMEQFGEANPQGERSEQERSEQDEPSERGDSRDQEADTEQQESSSDQQPGEPQQRNDQQEEAERQQQQGQGQAGEGQPRENEQQEQQPGQGEQNQEQQEPREGQGQGQGQPSENQSEQQRNQEQQQESESQSPGNQRGGNPSEQNQNRQRASQPSQGQRSTNAGSPGGNWDQPLAAPITGDDFREWSDRLRDVEEIVDDPELRAEAARIREEARNFRRDFIRHSKEPKWNLIQELVTNPLRGLRMEVSAELMRQAAEKNAIVPIDKDPVPQQYTEQVRRYYENLGSSE